MCTLEYVSSSFRTLQLIERLRHCHRNNFDLGCLRIHSPDWNGHGILLASRLRRDAGIVETGRNYRCCGVHEFRYSSLHRFPSPIILFLFLPRCMWKCGFNRGSFRTINGYRNLRIVGLWVSVSHDLAAVPDACAHAGNTCLREHYMYGSHTISWLFIRILLIQSNRILLSHPPTPVYIAS